MNYEIIKDISALEKFVEWLPDLLPHETYYVCLLARNKYVKDLGIGTSNSDKSQCKRFLSNKERLIEKIRHLECKVGSYVMKGIPIPQEALALYITPNPRDQMKATRSSLVKFAELIANGSTCHAPHQEAISQVHKSVGTKHFVDFDFDNVNFQTLSDKINEVINMDAVDVLETRGGFHLLVQPKKIDPQFEKTWYKNIMSLGVDQVKDNMIPMPGCTQGGFTPVLHSYSN